MKQILFFVLTTSVLLFFSCKPNKRKVVMTEIEKCKQIDINSDESLDKFNLQFNAVSSLIGDMEQNSNNSTDLTNLKNELVLLNKYRSEKLINYIKASISDAINSKDNLSLISNLSSKISFYYVKYIIGEHKDRLNNLVHELNKNKESIELDMKWTLWKNNLRNELRSEIEREWKIYLSQQNPRYRFLDTKIFEVNITENTFIDSPTEKKLLINVKGKLISTAETQGWISKRTNINAFEDKYEFNVTFSGTYIAKCSIGNNPYIENNELKFVIETNRKID